MADSFMLDHKPTLAERRAKRTELKGTGLRGPKLHEAMGAYRKEARDAQDEQLSQEVPETFRPYVKHPRKFLKSIMKGQGPAMRKLMRLRKASDLLGYNQNKDKLEDEYGRQFDALGEESPDQAGSKIEVERDFQEAPTMTAFQGYVGRHLNPETGEAMGLTKGEENGIRAEGMRDINANTNAAYANQGERMAAAGMDPRSGFGADQARSVAAARNNNVASLNRGITDANLQRKQQFEGYAQDLGRAEEQRRQYDVSGDLRRLADVETGQRDLAALSENQRQYDVGYTESQRQAKLARQAAARAAKDLEPSTLDKVAGGISGLVGSLGMGGGGGGGGGMMSMMGGK